MQSGTILVIEFEADGQLGRTLRRILESCPNREFTVAYHTCPGGDAVDDELSKIIVRHKPMLILPVLSRGHSKSLDALFQVLEPAASVASIVVVVESDQEDLIELVRPNVDDFILAPLRDSEVLLRVRRLINQSCEEQAAQQSLKEKLGLQQLIGQSTLFVSETGKIPIVAGSDASVMISGETGTGKEMVARAIHYLSPRASKPFVPVNCGAIPVELLENELFGHDRGAFTGAANAHHGLIQEAQEGTLFLDELNCMPLLAQVKLLRFLQSKEYRRLGSTKALNGDVRIIAASNADLEAELASGTLRRDLYYRLNVVPIVLPPLRARGNDIILLARHFLAQYAAKLNSPVVDLSPEAQRKLLLYSWPGNVRELEHVIERTLILCSEKIIREEDIVLPTGINPSQMSFQEMKANVIDEFETKYLQSLLAIYNGNITRAAQAAQKERRTFWELVRKHNIDVEKFKAAGAGH